MLTIQFGQCGNQLGNSLFNFVSEDISVKKNSLQCLAKKQYMEQGLEHWFSGISKDKYIARAILVDTEKKVIDKISSSSQWSYRPDNIIYQSAGGSANNWAYGYFMKGPQFKDDILNVLRKELERCDQHQGILMLLSSAGGTGSGVGSFMMEQLRDNFPTKTIIASVILPFSSGEVATQNYNTLLLLAKLQDFVDVGFLFENEQIHAICTNVLKNSNVQLKDINDIISKKLSAVLGPVTVSQYSIQHIISFIASHPAYKLATIKSTPYVATSVSVFENSLKWQLYTTHLKESLRIPVFSSKLVDAEIKMPTVMSKGRSSHVYCKSLANILVTRGMCSQADPITYEFEDKILYPNWVGACDRFKHFHENCTLRNQEKFAALLSNNSLIHEPLDSMVSNAWNTYIHSAFLHQYKKFNMEEDDFLHAFAKMESVINSYKKLNNY